jgi:alkylation response protein AidB-like acyl-CoA dehydrogenase
MIDLLTEPNSLWRDYVSPAERAFLEKVQAFAQHEVAPHVETWEDAEVMPRQIFSEAGRVGLMGITAPVEFGGQGFNDVTYALAIRELAKYHGALAIDISVHNSLGVKQLVAFGTAAQHQKVFPKVANGEWLIAWALTEPDVGSDIAGVQTTAVPSADGNWELTGLKRFIAQGRTAEVAVVTAAILSEKGNRMATAFLVDGSQIIPVRKMRTAGMRASDVWEIKFDRARGELLGARGEGRSAALMCLDHGRIGIAAVSLGLARAALDASVTRALTRRQFGMKIADFQALQFMLADCETELRAAEALVLQAAVLATRGLPSTAEVSMAKLFAAEAGSRICNRALQIHGGLGYTRDLPIERYWRDARLSEIGEGTNEVQRIVISRAMLRAAEVALTSAK